MTVSDQRLKGSSDEQLFAICRDERRVLITLGHDFGHVLRFLPETPLASWFWKALVVCLRASSPHASPS